jgi:hyaluronan synthase
MERAYQSFTGNVLCVSGPIGMYRITDLEKIIDKWSEQVFLGKQCTYGDDRHLTNLILGLGKNVMYVPNSYAETETPSSWYRFFKQQTRWNKSAFREFFWSVKILDKHSLFMSVDLVYVLVYPYIVMGYLMYILWYKTVIELGFYMSIVLLLGLIKSVYGTVVSGKYENMFYFMYVFMYVSTVFPGKIWALININDNSWGTSSRKIMSADVSFDIVVPLLWNSVLLGGFGYNIWRSNVLGFVFTDYLLLIIVFIILCLCLLIMWLYVTVKRNNRSRIRSQTIKAE